MAKNTFLIMENVKKIKVILFDIDGVLIRLPYNFSRELKKSGYENAAEIMDYFFNEIDYHQCLIGKADSKEMVARYLEKLGWKGSAESYFKKQFDFESRYVDKNLISLIEKLKNKGIACYLSTDQDKNRADFLLNDLGLKNIFEGYFVSCYLGFQKYEIGFWKKAIEELGKKFPGIKPDEIVFFDNTQKNIDTAQKFGIKTFLFMDIGQFEKDLISLNLK